MNGNELRHDRLRKVVNNAIEYNSVAWTLPVYRALVSRTIRAILPHVTQYIEKEKSRTGRPGINKRALPYIQVVGIEAALASAVSTTVNHFHRSLSHQSLSMKIGGAIANEWSLLQEDPDLLRRVLNQVHKGSNRIRRSIFIRQQMQRLLGRPLRSVSPIDRAAIGNLFLSFIERTQLVSLSRDSKKGMIIMASDAVLAHLEESLTTQAEDNPVGLPSLTPQPVSLDTIIRPQAGMNVSLSEVEDDTHFTRACTVLNNTRYRINTEQLAFVRELAQFRHGALGLPGHQAPELPPYVEGMDDNQRKAVRRQRALCYAQQRLWRGERTRLLSALNILDYYRNKEVFFNVQADFRGRIYPEAEVISYQGSDWIRSLWEFERGKEITDKRCADWLYVHAANCYGLARKPYEYRIDFIRTRMGLWRTLCAEPTECIQIIGEAEDPFRFLAAIREVVAYDQHGPGYVSHIPVQIDASSQAIQLWGGLTNDASLLERSNVTRPADGYSICHDIYKDVAQDIYADAMNSSEEGALHWRQQGVDRSTVKRCIMIIPYGGTFHSVARTVDEHHPTAPFTARLWLSRRIWEDGGDILHRPMKVQERASQAVSAHMRDTGQETLEWQAPSGILVRQRYMKTKRHRIKNTMGQTLHSYRLETDAVDTRKHGTTFAPNFLHSLDASLLVYAIDLMKDYGVEDIMPIHDCVGVHAADIDKTKYFLSVSFLWAVAQGREVLGDISNILGGYDFTPGPQYNGSQIPKDPHVLSGYLFS